MKAKAADSAAPRPQSQEDPRPRVARPDLSKMHTLEDFGYRFNESKFVCEYLLVEKHNFKNSYLPMSNLKKTLSLKGLDR